MPHVSRRKLNKKLQKQLFGDLLSVIAKAQKKERLWGVLEELFTRTEKVMLAKRLGLVLMLSNDVPQDKITKILKLSPTTVAKASLKMEIGKFRNIFEISQKEKVDLLKIIENILYARGIMPPRYGRKYWRKQARKR